MNGDILFMSEFSLHMSRKLFHFFNGGRHRAIRYRIGKEFHSFGLDKFTFPGKFQIMDFLARQSRNDDI